MSDGDGIAWAVSCGSYSAYQVICVCPSEADAEAVVATLNEAKDGWYDDSFVERLPFRRPEEVTSVPNFEIKCEIYDDGRVLEYENNEPREFGEHWNLNLDWPRCRAGWRWERFAGHAGGMLQVWGTDRERVGKVFSDRKAELVATSSLRLRDEAGGIKL